MKTESDRKKIFNGEKEMKNNKGAKEQSKTDYIKRRERKKN